MAWLILLVVLFLAWNNGGNGNFKGVATLYGSGTTSYSKALAWATITTFAGSLLTLVLAAGLVRTFSANGLVPDATANSPIFLGACALAAGLTVLDATFVGIPVSTTHALTGALIGAGFASGSGVNLNVLGKIFVLLLILSPVLSAGITIGLYPLARWARRALGVEKQSCICIGEELVPVVADGSGALIAVEVGAVPVAAASVRLAVAAGAECIDRYQGAVIGISAQSGLNGLHLVSAGAVCFARALNDTPKIVGILMGAKAVGANIGLGSVGVAMAIGGLIGSRKVAETMSKKIVPLNAGQGFVANLTTAALVIAASRYGLPVSTTHVATGSLFGIGTVTGTARWKTIVTILLAWVTTIPVGAALGALAMIVMRVVR